MAPSPVKFLVLFFLLSIVGWVVFIFAARLLAWFLSRIMGASVVFRVAGWNCLRDVVVKFNKGAIESVFVGEIKLSLRQSLVKLGVGFISRDPKLQLLICDLEVVMRPSSKSVKKKARTGKPRSAGRGKWMIVANMARFLSVSVTELAVKLPKVTIEAKDLRVDISKDGGSKPTLFVKLQLLPILVHMGDPRLSYDQSSSVSEGGCISPDQASLAGMDKAATPFVCEELSLSFEIGHDREVGVAVSNLDVTSGDITLNLNEKLITKNKTATDAFVQADTVGGTNVSEGVAIKSQKRQNTLQSLKKYSSMFPVKVSFNLPKLNVRFMHREQGLVVENNVMGINVRSGKSQSNEDMGESTHFDVQMDFSEIHFLREGSSSVLEILKLAIVSSIYVPLQPIAPLRAEIDIKLGGTQFNIIPSRLKPWIQLYLSKKKKMVLREEKPNLDRPQASENKLVMWTCTVSAPEMTVVLYSIFGARLYHGCSQSSHVFANNISNTGTAVHMELGELHLHMADEYQECLKESLFGVETNSGSLMHIAKVSLDWGKKEMESHDEHGLGRCKLVLSVDVTGMGVYFSFQRVESLISTAMSFQAILKDVSPSGKKETQNKGLRLAKPSGKGIQFLKLNLERCSVSFCGDVGVEDAVIADPKRVNYGSQGGRVVINTSADGSPRIANITSTVSSGCKKLSYSISLDIFHFNLCVNKEKQSTQIELERARSIYHEYLEEHRPHTKVTLFDMQNSKFVRRSGGLNEIAVCSLFSATDISVRWEPDAHLSLFELVLRLKLLIHNLKLQRRDLDIKEASSTGKTSEPENKTNADPVQTDKKPKKKESIFAIDVEMLNISAEVGDGVDAVVHVQSIFSENARIGVLLEGLMLSFNEARVFKSTRMQISRIPNPSVSSSSEDAKLQLPTTWDWVIQGLDVHICMPYRLQLRAIEDSIEDMLRALKLITAAKTSLIFPKSENRKVKKSSSTKFGCVKFSIRKLTADIEEEPMQGWLDEHYQLMKNEACEVAVRLKFLDSLSSEGVRSTGSSEPSDSCIKSCHHNGVEIDVHDSLAVQKLREEIHKNAFQSYYRACQNLVGSEGSGACKRGFQSGFKPSTARTSLLSVCATELDLTLTKIEGGEIGMIEIIKKLDPVCLEDNIPFTRLYGRNIVLSTGSLTVQLRNYTFPLFSAVVGKCEGRLVLAQQATCFQPQMSQDVFIGRWRKVRMLRSVSGTTPPMKTYSDLPIYFEKAEIGFGVGFEPSFADVSYAFTVALRRANLSVRNKLPGTQPPKKERSLPWWDEVRNYVHGKVSLYFGSTRWSILGTTDPYEKLDKLQVVSGYMVLQQSDGRVSVSAKDFKIFLSSLESLINYCSLKLPTNMCGAFLEAPSFSLEVNMDWECESGNPLNHYLYALPAEGKPREKVYDPFRSTSLSLRWNFSLRPSLPQCDNPFPSTSIAEQRVLDEVVYPSPYKAEHVAIDSPIVNIGAHDLAWLTKFWNLNYIPPHKLRSFSRWPRFGVPRAARSGNLSMDKVMTEFMLRVDAMPTCLKHMPLDDDDPASGLTFKTARLKYELCYSRGRQKYTFDCKRDPLDLVYQGLDLHMLKVFINKEYCTCVAKEVQMARKNSQSVSVDDTSNEKCNNKSGCTDKHRDDGFLLSSDYFTIRRQAPKADPTRLLSWQEAGKRNLEMTYVRSEFENGSDSDDHTRSDPSDDDGFNVVIADNCQRVFVYGLKLLWTIENRDAVWSFVGGISKAFEPPKPSPSRQYAQRKLFEENQVRDGDETLQYDTTQPSASVSQGTGSPTPQHVDNLGMLSSASAPKTEGSSSSAVAKNEITDDLEEEGTRHFMVNVIQPQFNLHSEDANGRFLLAAASGRVLARSFHSVLHVGYEMIEQALGTGSIHVPESEPEMTWKRAEFSVMLEHVQAHVAPTDVDPGAGLQWLPKILRSSPKVKRTGALLERVFMPCTMYFRYTRHKGGTADLKVKPLKELTFNSPNITATMTSRQFQVMLDVLSNLLFARLPKPRKSSLSCLAENDEDIEEEADEVVPDGVEEVELARINLEQMERERKLLLDDIRKLSITYDNHPGELCLSPEKDANLWMIAGRRSTLVQGLKKELVNTQKSRKAASASLRMALQKAAQLRLMEKEKNKSPSYAMRISLRINKVVWGMLADGKSFAEAEINNMIYDFDRDYKDVGVAKFTTKAFVVRNCLPNAKSDMLLSAWNPPSEWGKNVMLRVDAKQGAPKDGNSPLELFQVVIYPLKIHLTETMYRMMWEYFFPEEEQDSQRRQEVWKVSTTAGSKRVKKGAPVHEGASSGNHSSRESEGPAKLSASTIPLISAVANQSSTHGDASQASKLQNLKANIVCGSTPELRRTSSFDRTWEENVAETVANELVLHAHSSSISTRSGPLTSTAEPQEESSRGKTKDSKIIKSGRPSHDEKKVGKSHDEKRARARKMREFHNIKISQVELLVTYEGSRFAVSDLRLLMDSFHRVEFTGTWRRLFSRVKKHIIWGVLKSVTGMQGKKFKDKAHSQREPSGNAIPDGDLNFSDSDDGQAGKSDQFPISWLKRPSDGAGDGFVTSIRGLFNSQRRKAKAFVLRTMRGDADSEFHGEWSDSDVEFSPFARQLTITKARRLIRRHTKKFRSRGQKGTGSQQIESLPPSPRENTPFESDYSSGSSPYEDFNE